jgi:hypothetical protein
MMPNNRLTNGSAGLQGASGATNDAPFAVGYSAAHEGWDTKAHFLLGTGVLAEGSSYDEGVGLQHQANYLSPHRHKGFETGGSFNSNGSLRDNVSRDESNGFMGGGHRHFARRGDGDARGGGDGDEGRLSPSAQADHIGNGMHPTEGGSQHPPFEGVLSAGTSGRTTTSAFNADGTLGSNVSRDEHFQVGGHSRRHTGRSPEQVRRQPQPPAAASVPQPTGGFIYGTR